MSQFQLTIRAEEIVTATVFSPAVYADFNPDWKQRIAQRSREQSSKPLVVEVRRARSEGWVVWASPPRWNRIRWSGAGAILCTSAPRRFQPTRIGFGRTLVARKLQVYGHRYPVDDFFRCRSGHREMKKIIVSAVMPGVCVHWPIQNLDVAV
jgi:hypothetical protein